MVHLACDTNEDNPHGTCCGQFDFGDSVTVKFQNRTCSGCEMNRKKFEEYVETLAPRKGAKEGNRS